MSSSLFRSINIATLRYWCDNTPIIETIIYENVRLEMQTRTFKFIQDTDTYDLFLQDRRFLLELPESFELLKDSSQKTWEVC